MKNACIALLASLFIAVAMHAAPVIGATYTCSSCQGCSNILSGSLNPGDTVRLTADIVGVGTTTCIKFGGDLDHITLDCDGHTISNSDHSGGYTNNGYAIWIANVNNNVIKDCNIAYFTNGIWMFGSSNNEIININTTINNDGIVIMGGNLNTLTNITATNCFYDCIKIDTSNSNVLTNIDVHDGQDNYYLFHRGLYLTDSNSNIVTNLVSRNHDAGLIISESDNNIFTNMTIKDNTKGIQIDLSVNNRINDSIIYNNTYFGILFYYSIYDQYYNPVENNIFYNNYLNNTANLVIENDTSESTSTDYTNYWNTTKDCSSGLNILGGSCIGGNYWTDPDGGNYSDTCQDSDQDGICDSPYTILPGNIDELPLAAFASPDTIPPRPYFVSPTPSNGQTLTTKNWAYINVSSNEPLGSCLLNWNGVNVSMSVTGSTCQLNRTDLSNSAYTYRVYATDLSDNMNVTTTRTLTISYNPSDTAPPMPYFVSPTPSNGQTLTTKNWAYINVSSNEPLGSCLLNWNGVNVSMSVTGSTCQLNRTDLSNSAYTYRVYATDLSDNMNVTTTRTLTISYNSSGLVITDHYLPSIVESGEDVMIGINATDDEGVDSVWANITDPNGNAHHVTLVNNDLVFWTPTLKGIYNITIYANDTDGNVANVNDSFYVESGATLNLSLTDANGDELEARIDVYIAGSSKAIHNESRSDGLFAFDLVNGSYDLALTAFNSEFRIKALGVHVEQDSDLGIVLDRTDSSEFDHIFAINTSIAMSSAKLSIYYGDMGFDDTGNLTVMVCEDWNMTDAECNTTWENISSVINNQSGEFLTFDVQGFSAFGLKEGSYCGDGSCDSGETAGNCPEDCFCNEGETRSCNVAHRGICSSGTETCASNVWSGCPSPSSEFCNGKDDDCDGIVDNVGGGTSISQTKCQCYNDASPLPSESCNGLDDNCDGLIDNGADCCIAGQTRECGPANSTGLCKRGTAPCNGGIWSDCIGAVYPAQEICDDQLDNDCDGQVDEGCTVSQCPEGEIQSACSCDDTPRDSGYCCSGYFYQDGCPELPYWWLLVAAGAIILIVLVVIVLMLRKQGKELTWEELKRKYTSRER